MAYAALLLYVALLFVRPQEWIPLLGGIEVLGFGILDFVVAVALVAWLGGLKRRPWRLGQAPQNWLMLGLFFAVLMSHVAHTFLAAFIEAFQDFGKVVLVYFLIASLVSSVRRAKTLIGVMIVGCLFMSAWGIHQAHSLDHFGFVQFHPHFRAHVGHLPDGTDLVRVRALGFFHDPNDLALMMVAILPFLFAKVIDRQAPPGKRFLNAVAAAPILYCIYLTNSRGGWLALAVMLLAFFYLHWRNKKAATVIAVAACVVLLAVAPSRVDTISSEEGAAHGRLIAWGEGNRMLKRWPIFGAGYGRFSELTQSRLVAHNSFVHCWAELGLFGYFFWLGLVMASLKDGWALGRMPADEPEAQELARLGKATVAALVGFMAAAFFLSRTYKLPLFILLGLVAAMRTTYERDIGPLGKSFVPADCKYVLGAELVSIPALYLMIRVLG